MKPVGLRDPHTGERPWAVLQLRAENAAGTMWNMVGMQTRMKHHEQQRIFRMLPGLENAEFARFGSVHRNTFIQSPRCLNPSLEARAHPGLFFAGQITGVEGYVESTAAGLCSGLNAAALMAGTGTPRGLPRESATGALLSWITDPERKDFQPMNVSFGLIESYTAAPRLRGQSKEARRLEAANRALAAIRKHIESIQHVVPIAVSG